VEVGGIGNKEPWVMCHMGDRSQIHHECATLCSQSSLRRRKHLRADICDVNHS
jgi:hypothetical protein